MLFNSFQFLIFFPLVTLVYFLIPQKVRYVWLLVASYYFYMCWNPTYVLLLLFSTGVTYAGALAIEKYEAKKTFLVLTIVANLSVLFLFKYFDFAVDNINAVLGWFAKEPIRPAFDVLLPVGISFYTFQALGYTIDVYRKDIYAEKNFLKYALFVSFFPQLVAGPIERSKNLLKQLNEHHMFSYERMRKGLLIMLWGYFLKLVIADRAAIFVNAVFADYVTYGGLYIVVAVLLFSAQIYCDFAGYSVIAMGAALVMGFRLMDNFNAPFFAKNTADFWKRWHISLSGWFRDYLYFPLGGSRKGELRKQLNLLFVLVVSGLWHGASWNYVLWGGVNGLFQVGGFYLRKITGKIKTNFFVNTYRTCITFFIFSVSLLIFRAASVKDTFAMMGSVLRTDNWEIVANGDLFRLGLNQWHFLFLLFAIAVLLFVDYLKYKGIHVFEIVETKNVFVRYAVYMFLLCMVVFFGVYGVDYEASQFIYFQF